MSKLLYRLGKWSVQNRRKMLLGWVSVLAVIVIWAQVTEVKPSDSFSIPGTESQEAIDLLTDRFPAQSGTSAQIVFAAPQGASLDDPQVVDAIDAVLAEAATLDHVIAVTNPFEAGTISENGTVGYSDVRYDTQLRDLDSHAGDALVDLGSNVDESTVRIEFGGEVASGSGAHGASSELIGMGVAVIVLLFAFGSVLAMGLPLLTAIFGLGIGLMGIRVLGAYFDMGSDSSTLATMIAIAVGIDYALFIVTRHRHNLSTGLSVEESAARANATAGSAVVFAGGTVVIAIAGLSVVGIPFLTAMGLATAMTVAVAVAIAVSLLPALLGFAGTSIDRWKAPFTKTRTSEVHKDTMGARWSRAVTKRPAVALIGALAVMGTLAIPMLDMRPGMPDAGSSPTASTERQAYDLLAEGFGAGFNGPLTVVVDASVGSDLTTAADAVAAAIGADEGIFSVGPAVPNPAGDTAIISATPTSGPADAETEDTVKRIRNDILPPLEAATGAAVSLTGNTASDIDVSQKLADALPTFMMVVIGLTFILLMVAFRSILVPLKASLAILLSIVSSFGVVVAVFQWGWLNSLIGLDTTTPILSFMPLFMFAILFGLSMDYEVFIMSRIREEFIQTDDPHESVIQGLTTSARVITAAALIMISVFGSFVLGDDTTTKMFGLGLAVAVFLDATIVRMVIVPAAMALLDRAAWYLPKWLDRIIPNVDIEGEALLAELEAFDHTGDSPADDGGDKDDHGGAEGSPDQTRTPVVV